MSAKPRLEAAYRPSRIVRSLAALALALGVLPAAAPTAQPSAIVFNLSVRLASAHADPSVMISMKNAADDDYGFYPMQWLTATRSGHRIVYPLVLSHRISSVYAAVPAGGKLFLAASSTAGKIAVSGRPTWIPLTGFRENYGAGKYALAYCSHLATSATVCSNSVVIDLQ